MYAIRSYYDVYKNAEKLLRYEKADRLVLLTAVLFHDVKRGKNNHGRAGAVYVKKILKAIPEFPSEKINFVAETIATHSNKYECKSAEQKLLYDADKMDTFTELGIVRAFMIYSQQKFNLKNACFDYVNFLNSRYKKLNTKTAKKLVGEDYQNAIV